MNSIKKMLKSNKGFTFQDLTVAIILIIVFVGTIGSIYIAIYKVQADTRINNMASVYIVQIIEKIDLLAYDQVVEENLPTIIEQMKNEFEIEKRYNINLEIVPYGNKDVVKIVKLTISYSNKEEAEKTILVQRLKVKEL